MHLHALVFAPFSKLQPIHTYIGTAQPGDLIRVPFGVHTSLAIALSPATQPTFPCKNILEIVQTRALHPAATHFLQNLPNHQKYNVAKSLLPAEIREEKKITKITVQKIKKDKIEEKDLKKAQKILEKHKIIAISGQNTEKQITAIIAAANGETIEIRPDTTQTEWRNTVAQTGKTAFLKIEIKNIELKHKNLKIPKLTGKIEIYEIQNGNWIAADKKLKISGKTKIEDQNLELDGEITLKTTEIPQNLKATFQNVAIKTGWLKIGGKKRNFSTFGKVKAEIESKINKSDERHARESATSDNSRGKSSGVGFSSVENESWINPIPRMGIFIPRTPKIWLIRDDHSENWHDPLLGIDPRDILLHRAKKEKTTIIFASPFAVRPEIVKIADTHIADFQKPKISIKITSSRGAGALPATLLEPLRDAVTAGQNSLLLCGRSGAGILICHDCGEIWRHDCDRAMTLQKNRAICGNCRITADLPEKCPCGSTDLRITGGGVARTAATLRTEFPTAQILEIEGENTINFKKLDLESPKIIVTTSKIFHLKNIPKIHLAALIHPEVCFAGVHAEWRLFTIFHRLTAIAKPEIMYICTSAPEWAGWKHVFTKPNLEN